MLYVQPGYRRSLASTLIAMFIAALGSGMPALAYKPEDPTVKQMVERGLNYLASNQLQEVPNFADTKEGVAMLIGYAAHKAGRGEDDPLVTRGVETSLKISRKRFTRNSTHMMYELTMGILMLTDIDAKFYNKEIKAMVDQLVAAQRPHGGWGYMHEEIGDTSQTQYAMLALWTADRADFEVPQQTMERGLGWLLRTQDTTGGFGYHSRDPGPNAARVSQEGVTRSLTFAGMGTIIIAGDYLQFYQGTGETAEDLGLPKAFRRVRKSDASKRVSAYKKEQIESAVTGGIGWMQKTPYQRSATTWHYYAAYAAERFYSFYELSQGNQEPEPEWYNRGVEELLQAQGTDGSWAHKMDQSREDPMSATAFAILYLVRSTKKAIGTINQGMLTGGSGLPKNTRGAKLGEDGVKGNEVAESLNDMLKMLEDEEAEEIDPDAIPPALPLSADKQERAKQLERLERLAIGQNSNLPNAWAARRMAVRTLISSGELTIAPTLIVALGDEDKPVMRMARDGLKMLSRRFEGFGLSDNPTREEIIREQRKWKEWYLGLVPGHVFIE